MIDATLQFYRQVYGRESLGGDTKPIVASIHYGKDFDNALWNGAQLVIGDRSNRLFRRGSLTGAVDIIAHELTHAVISTTARLAYSGQSGALNESFADVFGCLVRQFQLRQSGRKPIGSSVMAS